MRKLILMSVLIVPLLVAIRQSRQRTPQRGVRQTVTLVALFLLFWGVLAPRLYFLFPDE